MKRMSIAAVLAVVALTSLTYGATTVVKEFKAYHGTLTKATGQFAWTLTAQKKKSAVALKKLNKPITGKATFHLKLQAAQKKGTRNGFLVLQGKHGQAIAGVYIGGQQFAIQGHAVKKNAVVPDKKMDQKGVFDLTVTVDLPNKTITMANHGKQVAKANLSEHCKAITKVGYLASNTSTSFTNITINH